MRCRTSAQIHVAHGVGKPVGRGEAHAAPVREQIAPATRDVLQVFQHCYCLHRQRTDMVTPRFHLRRRSTPQRILKVELVPLGIRSFPWTAGSQRNQPQAQRGFRIAPVAAQLLIELLDLLSRHRRLALAERHAQQPAQTGDRIGLDQTTHHRELEDGRKITFDVNGRPRAMCLAFLQQRADLFHTDVAHRQPIKLRRQVLPDAGLFRAVGTERKDWLDLGQVRLRHLGERAFLCALAFLQRLQVALFDLPPLMGRMDALLDQGACLLTGRTRLSKAYLRKTANGKEVLLALQAVLPPPELAAGGLDQQEQAPAV